MSCAYAPTPTATEEVPRMLPGKSQEETPPPTRTHTDPVKGGGTLLLGMNAARTVIGQYVSLSDTAQVVVIPMTGEGDRCCDGVFMG